jgi:hypothetical protein
MLLCCGLVFEVPVCGFFEEREDGWCGFHRFHSGVRRPLFYFEYYRYMPSCTRLELLLLLRMVLQPKTAYYHHSGPLLVSPVRFFLGKASDERGRMKSVVTDISLASPELKKYFEDCFPLKSCRYRSSLTSL